MSGPVVIGIVGRKHHGKTTCANMIARIYSGEVQSLAFADILKSSLAILSGEPLSYYHDEVLKEEYSVAMGMSRRLAMQSFGDSVRNVFGEDFFISRLRHQMRALNAKGKTVIFSDVRYCSEAEFIKKNGGILLRVHRGSPTGHVVLEDDDDDIIPAADSTDNHASETESDKIRCDIKINNTGSLKQMENIVSIAVSMAITKRTMRI